MAGEDIHVPSSSSASSHRLPTVSASQALQTLHVQGSRAVSTGLAPLDKALAPHGLPGRSVSGGYMRGKVTEIFGPPGVGKTAFGIQAAANALRDGHRAVWVDAACAPLAAQRVHDVLLAVTVAPEAPETPETPETIEVPRPLDERHNHFHHYTAPTLAHLLALFVHRPSAFPPPNTGLIVIDSLSTLFDNAYPRNADNRGARNKSEQARWAAGRKFAVMNELIVTLTRVAALHDIALLVTCQTITRMRGGSRALLVPAISGAEWENGISTRVVLFRDWAAQKARFAGILKTNGVTLADEGGVGEVVPFSIDSVRLGAMNIAAVDITTPTISTEARPLKRQFAEMDDEEGHEGLNGPDSDELYGWIEDDEVAAEGLVVVETSMAPDVDTAESRATPAAESQSQSQSHSQMNDSVDPRRVTRPKTF
ncbi:P-loop containing nucleoside triphosphate hydrolase protein [Massarina eburnea CBS 473.64]|uniref:P-loop containing nucleoside triphosphate hydrolase protein n=1 Tax=Massarina eburnea CBS 473.64 TaxID=1395130 RepID=A0A6A6RNP6_9PLEO|nr:P-loop containing nucleoside triphosphate hydrolase protein [Massarina eburnea CBS 473.64]